MLGEKNVAGVIDVRPDTREIIKGCIILIVFFLLMALKERYL